MFENRFHSVWEFWLYDIWYDVLNFEVFPEKDEDSRCSFSSQSDRKMIEKFSFSPPSCYAPLAPFASLNPTTRRSQITISVLHICLSKVSLYRAFAVMQISTEILSFREKRVDRQGESDRDSWITNLSSADRKFRRALPVITTKVFPVGILSTLHPVREKGQWNVIAIVESFMNGMKNSVQTFRRPPDR